MSTISKRSTWVGLAMASLPLLQLACGLLDAPDTVLVNNQNVNLARGGGSVDVLFRALAGQPIRVTLTASEPGAIPYGQLLTPTGAVLSVPPFDTALDGVNVAEVIVTQTGAYTLTVLDNAGVGGAVRVRVEIVTASAVPVPTTQSASPTSANRRQRTA